MEKVLHSKKGFFKRLATKNSGINFFTLNMVMKKKTFYKHSINKFKDLLKII